MLEIALSGEDDWPEDTDWSALAAKAVKAAVRETPCAFLADMHMRVELSIRLSNDDEVQSLNRDYREKDTPTNVLSFPMMDADDIDALAQADAEESLLGDIILAKGVCVREAADKGIAVENHAAHLIVHGTLHLLGYDHMIDEEAEAMEAIEVRALSRIDIADPYAPTTGE
jgi:probable rRNA maturation factor